MITTTVSPSIARATQHTRRSTVTLILHVTHLKHRLRELDTTPLQTIKTCSTRLGVWHKRHHAPPNHSRERASQDKQGTFEQIEIDLPTRWPVASSRSIRHKIYYSRFGLRIAPGQSTTSYIENCHRQLRQKTSQTAPPQQPRANDKRPSHPKRLNSQEKSDMAFLPPSQPPGLALAHGHDMLQRIAMNALEENIR